MSKKSIWSLAFALLFAGLFGGSSAEAQVAGVPLGNAYTAIGRFTGSNQTYLVSMDINTGNCQRAAVGPSTGLASGTTFVVGTALPDWIFFVDTANTSWCGSWGLMQPVTRNVGNWVNINAGDTTDVVDGRNQPRIRLGGDNGDDIVMSNGTANTVELYGFNGNDHFYTGTNAKVFGENDNDWLCVNSGQQVLSYTGGAGNDFYCGSVATASSATFSCPCQ